MESGLIHLYWGCGKGKTTAAVGLALRALGRGKRVVFLQFLKDGSSGEIVLLQRAGASVLHGMNSAKFVFQMTENEKAETKAMQTEVLLQAIVLTQSGACDLLVLDEACAAWQLDMVDRALLQQAVQAKPDSVEVVLTGREPAQWMLDSADYSTEMRCHRHPFDQGTAARQGVEY